MEKLTHTGKQVVANRQSVATAISEGVEKNGAIQLEDNRPRSVLQMKQTGQNTIQKKENNTGLPDNLKSGIENLSGHSMDDVKVHYNSSQPAQLNAHAYAQGNQIHVAPGQEKHLPHEAWHVVQQKQGRVKPTAQLKGKTNLNDDAGLEKEADVMGAKAVQLSADTGSEIAQRTFSIGNGMAIQRYEVNGHLVLQRVLRFDGDPVKSLDDLDGPINVGAVRAQINLNLHREVSRQEIDNAVRSVDLGIGSSRDESKIAENQQAVILHLSKEIAQNSHMSTDGYAGRVLTGIIDDPLVVQKLEEQLGNRELERLREPIRIMWESGQVNVSKMIKILQEPAITHTYEQRFAHLLMGPAQHPLVMKMLGNKSVVEIVDMLKNQTEENLLQHAQGAEHIANEQEINPTHVVEINTGERYSDLGSKLANLQHDLTIVKNDDDNNLKEDLAYMADLQRRYNHAAPDSPDHEMLKTELDRMKKIYTHKVNYITIMNSWPDFRPMEAKLKKDLLALEKKCAEDIQGWEYGHASLTKFKPKTTQGYMMKMTRKAERERPALDEKIAQRRVRLRQEIAAAKKQVEDAKNAFHTSVSNFLKIDQRYFELIQSGVMLLPSDMRPAGIFPKSKSVHIDQSNKAQRHEILQQHARDLLMDHGLYQGTSHAKKGKPAKIGMLPASRIGCICIMYIKEGHMNSEQGATFRPVFGASGADPYGNMGHDHEVSREQVEENSYVNMGVPRPDQTHVSHERTAASLQQQVTSMTRLGIKPPSMQSQLYFLQTPEYRANKINEMEDQSSVPPALIEQARRNTIGMLENWMPSNCAEPAIMTAIYQLYSKPSDIYLSVPFEGTLSNGKLLLKYTCTRCALSEPAFMSPDTHGQRLTDMRLQQGRPPLIGQHLAAPGLVTNEEHAPHPYAHKTAAIDRTVWRNQGKGFGHVKPGHEAMARQTTLMIQEIDAAINALLEMLLHRGGTI